MLDKGKIYKELLIRLEEEVNQARVQAKLQHELATDSGMKQENKYDTRAIEASYMASGQARRVSSMEIALKNLKSLELKVFGPKDPIASGALIELEWNGEDRNYFISPGTGGFDLNLDGEVVKIVTPQSPIGDALLGLKLFDQTEIEVNGQEIEIEILGLE